MVNLKEVIGKARKTQPPLPSKIIVRCIKINEDKQITDEFKISLKILAQSKQKRSQDPQVLSKAMYQNQLDCAHWTN